VDRCLAKKTQELKDELREFDDEIQFLAAPNQQVLLSLAQEDRWTMRFSFVLSIACLFVLGITGRVEVAKGQVSASGCEDGQVITRMANAKTSWPGFEDVQDPRKKCYMERLTWSRKAWRPECAPFHPSDRALLRRSTLHRARTLLRSRDNLNDCPACRINFTTVELDQVVISGISEAHRRSGLAPGPWRFAK
jgi:hypothetical protein